MVSVVMTTVETKQPDPTSAGLRRSSNKEMSFGKQLGANIPAPFKDQSASSDARDPFSQVAVPETSGSSTGSLGRFAAAPARANRAVHKDQIEDVATDVTHGTTKTLNRLNDTSPGRTGAAMFGDGAATDKSAAVVEPPAKKGRDAQPVVTKRSGVVAAPTETAKDVIPVTVEPEAPAGTDEMPVESLSKSSDVLSAGGDRQAAVSDSLAYSNRFIDSSLTVSTGVASVPKEKALAGTAHASSQGKLATPEVVAAVAKASSKIPASADGARRIEFTSPSAGGADSAVTLIVPVAGPNEVLRSGAGVEEGGSKVSSPPVGSSTSGGPIGFADLGGHNGGALSQRGEIATMGTSMLSPAGEPALTGTKADSSKEVSPTDLAQGSEKKTGVSSVYAAMERNEVATGAVLGGVVGHEVLVGGRGNGPMLGSGASLPHHTELGESELGGSVVGSDVVTPHQMLLATPTTLEVGLPSGTQGWLRIRAEMTDGGSVNASLSSANAGGQEMLHRELPNLTAYLQQERVAVNSVVVHREGSASFGNESTLASGKNSDDRGQGQPEGPAERGEDRTNAVRVTTLVDQERSDFDGVSVDGILRPGEAASGGGWLDLRV